MRRRVVLTVVLFLLAAATALGARHSRWLWEHATLTRVETITPSGRLEIHHEKRWGEDKGQWHGPFVEYYRDSDIPQRRGRFHLGAPDGGVWTYFEAGGEVTFQHRYLGDAVEEARSEPPWWPIDR